MIVVLQKLLMAIKKNMFKLLLLEQHTSFHEIFTINY